MQDALTLAHLVHSANAYAACFEAARCYGHDAPWSQVRDFAHALSPVEGAEMLTDVLEEAHDALTRLTA
jgi:hypothetical protein